MRLPKTFRLFPAALALALAGASCASKPPPRESPVAPPEAFSETGGVALPERWWRAFDDAALNDLVDRALSDNFSLRAARQRLDQADAVMRRQGAEQRPKLNATAGAARIEQRSTTTEGGVETTRTAGREEYSLGLAASYEIDLWGRLGALGEAATLDAEAAAEDLSAAAVSLSAEVTLAWFRLAEKQGQADLIERQLQTNTNALELIELRFRRGQADAADVLQQRQLVESSRAEMALVRAAQDTLAHRLAVLTGAPPKSPLPPPAPGVREPPAMPAAGLPAELLQRRPDLRRASARLRAADRRAAAAVAERFPRLTLTGHATTSTDDVANLFDTWLASLAGELAAPLVDGGSRRAEVDRTRAVVREQLNLYGQAVLEALAETEDAIAREGRQRELLASLAAQLDLSRQSAERIRDNYLKGGTDYLRVLDAVLRLQSLQRRELEARLALLETRVALYRALAGAWTSGPPPGVNPSDKDATDD